VTACSKPCSQCPYRRQSLQGYLGESDPEEFMELTMSDYPMPCHQTVDYREPQWKKKWEAGQVGKLCAGALIFFANICKRSRDGSRPTIPADRELVFSRPDEFIDYHNAAKVKSWKL